MKLATEQSADCKQRGMVMVRMGTHETSWGGDGSEGIVRIVIGTTVRREKVKGLFYAICQSSVVSATSVRQQATNTACGHDNLQPQNPNPNHDIHASDGKTEIVCDFQIFPLS